MEMRIRLWLCLLFPACVSVLQAHPNLQNTMWVQFEPNLVRVAVNVSLKELAVASGLSLPEGGEPEARLLDEAAGRHKAYLLGHLRVSVETEALSGSVLKLTPPQYHTDPEQTFYQYELEYPYGGRPPREVEFFHDMLREWPYSEKIAWEMSYVVRSKRMGDEQSSSWLLRTGQPAVLRTGFGDPAAGAEGVAALEENGWPGASLLAQLRTWLELFQRGAIVALSHRDHLLFAGLLALALFSQRQLALAMMALTAGIVLAALAAGFGDLDWFKPWAGVAGSLCAVLFALGNLLARERAFSRVRFAVIAAFGFASGFGSLRDPRNAELLNFQDGGWASCAAYVLGVVGAYEAFLLPALLLFEALRRREVALVRPLFLRFGAGLLALGAVFSLALNLRR